ncbi:Rv0361 family membrane protein [Mycobacterium sp. C31M]
MSNPTEPEDGKPEPTPDAPEGEDSSERRFTAPSGFDGSTQIIDAVPEPVTEMFSAGEPTEVIDSAAITDSAKAASPQMIPPREDAPKPPQQRRRSWGWVIAVVLVIAAVAALAILGTVLLTRGNAGATSQEDQVRSTIESFDVAIQKGDLAALRGLTCGATRDSYVHYDDNAWTDTHRRVAAAKQYPVVASIDEVVVVDDHAEANVTTFMAYAPQTRSTRSFDLQFRDDQWKICQNG